MRECSFTILLCMLCLSKARTKFQSDFHRRTNRFKWKKKYRCDKNKMDAEMRKWRRRKKWSQGKRTITVTIHTPPPPRRCHLQKEKIFIMKAFYNILPRLLIENVSKSNYSALLLTANDEVHTHWRAQPATTTTISTGKKWSLNRSRLKIICSFKSNYKDFYCAEW